MSSVTPAAGDQRPAASDHRWLILVIVAIAQLMVVLDATVVNIALPSAQHALGFPNGDRQWVVTAYALAFGSLLLLGGRLGDLFGRKRVFIIGLIGFAAASALGGAATSFGMLVSGPAASGRCSAPCSRPRRCHPGQRPSPTRASAARAFGVFGAIAGGGGAVGLLLGGVLTEYLSWRWTLYVNLFFAAIAVAGALAAAGNRPATAVHGWTWPARLVASAGLFGMVYGFSHAETARLDAADDHRPAGRRGGPAGRVRAGREPRSASAAAAADRPGPRPGWLLPGRRPDRRSAVFGVFLFLTYYLQLIMGYSPVTTGLAFLPMIARILPPRPRPASLLLPRVGPRVLIPAGMLLGGGGHGLLTQLA